MPDLGLVNRDTGQPATPAEYAVAVQRARQIIESPYSSPEQIEWALGFPDMDNMFWESANERKGWPIPGIRRDHVAT